jgi:tripartite-type tricarboxylate transporter receptor subunit TctC
MRLENATLASSANILVVHPSLPVKSVNELIALAKKKPGQLTYGSGGVGTSSHLAVALFESMTGTKFPHVPYKGANQTTSLRHIGSANEGASPSPARCPRP